MRNMFPFDNVMLNLNSLWPSDAIWRQRSESTLVQPMTCCLTANVDLSSMGFCCKRILQEVLKISIREIGFCGRRILQGMLKISIRKISLKNRLSKLIQRQ